MRTRTDLSVSNGVADAYVDASFSLRIFVTLHGQISKTSRSSGSFERARWVQVFLVKEGVTGRHFPNRAALGSLEPNSITWVEL